jgi:carbon-monoxide dehydrogenase medium subunit
LSLAFKPKSYLVPKDERDVSSYLKEHRERGRIIAGGTGIYEIAHRGLLSELEVLIDIRNLGLSYVEASGETLHIGATTTMTQMAASSDVQNRKEALAIADALKAIQPLQVKNVATIAGAICTALPFFDLPVALLSVNAEVKIFPGEKAIPLSDFIQGYFSVGLEQGEFVKEVIVPLDQKNEKKASAFQKFAITHDDWALINCGVSVTLEADRIAECTVYFGGGVGEKPTRARALEAELRGVDPKEESKIEELFEVKIPKDLETVSDIRASAEYRMRLAKVIGRRTFLQALGRI